MIFGPKYSIELRTELTLEGVRMVCPGAPGPISLAPIGGKRGEPAGVARGSASARQAYMYPKLSIFG